MIILICQFAEFWWWLQTFNHNKNNNNVNGDDDNDNDGQIDDHNLIIINESFINRELLSSEILIDQHRNTMR